MEIRHIPLFKGIDLAERRIPILVERSPKPGPVLWLIAATHGNEVTGIPVIHRIFKFLERNPLKCGTVYGMPILNVLGFELNRREHPYDNEDINRMFPGDLTGDTSERTAAVVYNNIIETKPSFVIDMHCDVPDSIPYILIDRPLSSATGVKETVERSWRLADKFGVTVTYDLETEGYKKYKLDKTLTAALINRAGVPAFVAELGGPNSLVEGLIRIGTKGVKNILAELGMIEAEGSPFVHDSKIKSARRLEQLKEIATSESGLIEFHVKPGQHVKAGQELAEIINVLGKTEEVIRAPKDCYIISLADMAISFPGSQIISAAAEEKGSK
ncbi:succinylglutamate desuccinylase/aspartoacylase family protein [Patescibacteria group bacterium]|nr:succinylglutamate desuccinylase/aspartoacylase family protein [Patescibacteria group bacterium]MBU1907013.1 succinylglutamate desuccinylase/aspartoacylase family protein [Patescibacteria group bacterium]